MVNSLLPVCRYINMDPTLTELVISQTQFISFGQSFFGWICDNSLHLPSIITDNIVKLRQGSGKEGQGMALKAKGFIA